MKPQRSNTISISKLLSDFYISINNRSIVFLVVLQEVLPKILDWHFKVWKKKDQYSDTDIRKWGEYDVLSRTLNSIIKTIEERALKESNFSYFLESFKKHIETYKKEELKDKNRKVRYYIEYLFRIFYQVFFNNINDAPERYEIWECLPDELKMTKGNLESKDNIVSRISYREFERWALPRIQQPVEDFDKNLEDVIQNLFPEVEPIRWSKILLFIYSLNDPDNRVKSVIERKWNFGHIGRGFGSTGGNEEEFKKKSEEFFQEQTEKTLELALFLFKDFFTKELLEKYIEELKGLTYDNKSEEGIKKSYLLGIFEKMLEKVNKCN